MEINDTKAKKLGYFLIHYIQENFKYELNSPVYHVIIQITNLIKQAFFYNYFCLN